MKPHTIDAPHGAAPGLDGLALFLDVDGTLLELAATPDRVNVPPGTISLLRGLALRTAGAVALVSGRSIASLDDLFAPLLLPAAGLHGFERRNAVSVYCRQAPPDNMAIDRARRLLTEFVERHPGLLLEDKRFALALHYRAAPQLQPAVEQVIEAVARAIGEQLDVQRGRMVIELRPVGASKALALAAFMQEPPFRGRRPVMIGDDLTDECAFEWVNAVGGLSIAVDVPCQTAATAHLPGVPQVHAWLSALLAGSG